MGDATRDRIAKLENGWSVPDEDHEITEKKAEPVKPRPPTDPVDVVPTAPFERSPEPELLDMVPTTTTAPEALEVLRGATARRSDSEIQRSLTPMHLVTPKATPPPVPRSGRDERNDDATTIEPPSTLADRASASLAGAPRAVLRVGPTLGRRPGVVGDLRYVFTVFFGLRRARRELLDAEDEITTLKADRASRLADLGRAAISDDRFDQTAVRVSRDLLADIEDRRSRHAGAAAAADAELDAIERERESSLRRIGDQLEAAQEEVTRLDKEIGPLERESGAVRKRAAQLKETLSNIDGKIAAARASLVSIKGPDRDAAAVEAELASLCADREAVARDEPGLAAELDALLPRIASLESARGDAQARITAARAAEADARSRANEQVAAVQARRRVENRAAADARHLSERALVELGERLYVERPTDLTLRLGAVESQDLAIATATRRAIEQRELIASVERGALWRGILWWALLIAMVATAIVLIV